ncbi:MAG: cytochrome b/b6 domain-containing protein [Pararhodobacter sp.]|nr:cytochrome b/b6 domain-containing protein [Pararhodobacter sp.]
MSRHDLSAKGPLIYRQSIWTRATHWIWAVCLFFLMLTGLQIFNAYPKLDIGKESGFEYDNSVFEIGARQIGGEVRGFTRMFGRELDTTGVLGVSNGQVRAFPAAVTIPSNRDLATGRVIHFFFAWLLAGTLAIWLVAGVLTGHLRQLLPRTGDLRALGPDIANHARLRFHHRRRYGALQKLAYAGVMFILLPMMFLTGLSMSPSFNAVAPWLLDVFGGRQTARTLHFLVMLLLIGFFVIHILMVLASGPLNALRSMLSGWYRVDPELQSGADEPGHQPPTQKET